jgi:hypothetical protein
MLRRALGAVMPSSTQSIHATCEVGRHGHGPPGDWNNPVMCERVEIPTTGGSKGSDGVPGGGLLRRQEWRRGVRGNLDRLVLVGAS